MKVAIMKTVQLFDAIFCVQALSCMCSIVIQKMQFDRFVTSGDLVYFYVLVTCMLLLL